MGLWLIPVLVMAYIGWMNVQPLGAIASYQIDVGGIDASGEARISGTLDNLSAARDTDGTSFRDLKGGRLDFELNSAALRNADEIAVSVRFKDTLPNDGRLLLGAGEKAGQGYVWKPGYAPFYEGLRDLPLVTESGNLRVYATGDNNQANFLSVDEFLRNLPSGSVVATDDPGLMLKREISIEDSEKVVAGEFAFAEPPLAPSDSNSGSLDWDTSIRGSHDFFLLSQGGLFELTVTKRDVNLYEGDDKLDILIYSLDGTLEATVAIDGDGDATASGLLGFAQKATVKVEGLEKGTHRLVLKSDGRNDLVITRLSLNQGKLVTSGKVFLAGNLYLGGQPAPMSVYCYLPDAAQITLSVPHSAAIQSVNVSGPGYDQNVRIDNVNAKFSTSRLEAGMYRITAEKGDVLIQTPSGYFGLPDGSSFTPVSRPNGVQDGRLTINTSLRGSHTLWTHVNDGTLEVAVTKQDLNWNENPDVLTFNVYSVSGELKGSAAIQDDGDSSQGKKRGALQSESLRIDGLPAGSYRLELKASGDVLIRKIEINQTKLVVDGKLWPIGMNTSYFERGLDFDPLTLYGKSAKAADTTLYSYHDSGLQVVRVQGEDFDQRSDVSKVNTSFNVAGQPGPFLLTAPRQNLLIESDGYLSFTPDSFFVPIGGELIDLKYDLAWARDHADFIVVNSGEYVPPKRDGGWLVAQAHWSKDDLLVAGNKAIFSLNASFVEGESAVSIDRIEIKVKALSFLDRLARVMGNDND